MANVADMLMAPLHTPFGVSGNKRALLLGRVLLTTSGAISSYAGSDPGVTVAGPASNKYTFTFPACKAIWPMVQIMDATGVSSRAEAVSATASTGAVVVATSEEDTSDSHNFEAADGTTGDTILVLALCEYD